MFFPPGGVRGGGGDPAGAGGRTRSGGGGGSCRGVGADPVGAWGRILLVRLGVFFHPVGADVPGRRGGGCWRSCRGLFAFYTLPCLVFLLIIWKNSSRAAADVPGGVVFFHPVGAGVRFLLKKRTKKRKHGNV